MRCKLCSVMNIRFDMTLLIYRKFLHMNISFVYYYSCIVYTTTIKHTTIAVGYNVLTSQL